MNGQLNKCKGVTDHEREKQWKTEKGTSKGNKIEMGGIERTQFGKTENLNLSSRFMTYSLYGTGDFICPV